jgi:serine/threonine protein kinase
MGVVYLAHNRLMSRNEVLKVVGPQVLERAGVLERFLREIRSVATLRHPNIVAAYTAFRLGQSFVFAMEYVEGLDLARLVKAKGPLPVAHACSFAHQTALGLQHAHEQGMVHRDIKPGNLMLSSRDGRALVQILDFGLAKVAREEPADGGLTHEGQMLGTPDYIAPEQTIDAQKADTRADIYSLGCTLYYLLTGAPPFRGRSLYEVLQAHHSMDARPVNLVRPEVQVELAAVIARMMAKEPDRRYQTPREVARALTPFFKKGSIGSANPTAELSQAGPAGALEFSPQTEAVPTRPDADSKPAAMRVASTVVDEPGTESKWDNLLGASGTESLTKPSAVLASSRWPRWAWPAVASGVLLVSFFAAWAAGVFKIKTKDGVIVLENVPANAEVSVDGAKVTLRWPEGGGPLEITVPPGKRGIEVRKDGFKTFGQEVTVESGDHTKIRVALVPLAALPAPPVTTAEPPVTKPAPPVTPSNSSKPAVRTADSAKPPITTADSSTLPDRSKPASGAQRPPGPTPRLGVSPPERKASTILPRNRWIVLDAVDAQINGNQAGKAQNGVLMLYPPVGQGNNASWSNPSIHARNMIIRARVKKPDWDGGTIGLNLRFNPRTWECYGAVLAKHDRREGYSFRIEKAFARGTPGQGWTTLKNSVNRPVARLEIDDFFELSFSAIGDALTVAVNGKRIVQARDSDFKEGTIMLGAWQCRAFFKAVEVKVLDE